MLLRKISYAVLIGLILHVSHGWYVLRELETNEKCVNVTIKMGGSDLCPLTTFAIVNTTRNLATDDRLAMLKAFPREVWKI